MVENDDDEAGGGRGVEGSRVKHAFAASGTGSPKTVLVQSTPPVNCLGLVNFPFAPYTTSLVSLKEQRPFSLAQKVHDESGGGSRVEHDFATPGTGSSKRVM